MFKSAFQTCQEVPQWTLVFIDLKVLYYNTYILKVWNNSDVLFVSNESTDTTTLF